MGRENKTRFATRPNAALEQRMSLAPTQLPVEQSYTERVSTDTVEWYFRQCEEHRDLLNDIYVVVPVRPSEGVNCKLGRMLSVWYGEGTAYSHLNDHMGGFIECTRGNIVWTFLKNPPLKPDGTPCKYLLMIDNDMEPPINLPYMLARHGKDVVGVCAMSVDQDYGPQLCFSVKSEDGKYRFPSLRSKKPIPAKGLVEVGHVGTGALLLSREVLEKFTWDSSDEVPFLVPDEVRIAGMKTGTLTIGEDIRFCNQLRAKGVKMHVDLEAHCGHRKTLGLEWDENMRDKFLDADSWVVPASGKEITSR